MYAGQSPRVQTRPHVRRPIPTYEEPQEQAYYARTELRMHEYVLRM